MQRESFGSRLGFLLVSAGCAIGMMEAEFWKQNRDQSGH